MFISNFGCDPYSSLLHSATGTKSSPEIKYIIIFSKQFWIDGLSRFAIQASGDETAPAGLPEVLKTYCLAFLLISYNPHTFYVSVVINKSRNTALLP